MQKTNARQTLSIHSIILLVFCLTVFMSLLQIDTSFAETKQAADNEKTIAKTEKPAIKHLSEVEKALQRTIHPPKAKEPKLFDIYAATTERTLGDPKAPITVIEYASMTCPHCAAFHSTTFSEVKKQFIDTGKVYWIFREFPLDKLALRASMMSRCLAPSMYFNLIEVLFTSQSRWLGNDKPMKALEQTGRLAGMTPELFEECIGNTELEMHVLKNMQTGQNQWQVKSTPTFIINYGEERMGGARKIEEFQEIFDKLLQKHGAK